MKLITFTIIAALSVSTPLFGDHKPGSPNWDATLATQTANLPENQTQLQELFGLVQNKDLEALERRLDAVISGGALSQPARDAILFRFAVGLADFDHVDPAIFDQLLNVTPTVLISHEERASVGLPMFNIAGAAEGALKFHQRLDARADANLALSISAETWVDSFLLANHTQRLGFVDSLDSTSSKELAEILNSGLDRLANNPELTPAAGKSALLLGDTFALQQLVRDGSGAELARILEAAGHTLPRQDSLELLSYAIAQAPPVNAALAIAQLYAPLADLPEAGELLFDQLDDADLGAAAALALASTGNPEITVRLQRIAQSDAGLASARARVALESGFTSGGLD